MAWKHPIAVGSTRNRLVSREGVRKNHYTNDRISHFHSWALSKTPITHLEALLPQCVVRPHVNQIECHLRSAQRMLHEYCLENGIAVTAYSPLKGVDLTNPVLGAIAATHGVSPATIALRWLLQRGIAVIPRSSKPERVVSNFADCATALVLSQAEMARLFALDEGGGSWQDIL
jgi:diketogulonate reductase-like aldo/keto reductase